MIHASNSKVFFHVGSLAFDAWHWPTLEFLPNADGQSSVCGVFQVDSGLWIKSFAAAPFESMALAALRLG